MLASFLVINCTTKMRSNSTKYEVWMFAILLVVGHFAGKAQRYSMTYLIVSSYLPS